MMFLITSLILALCLIYIVLVAMQLRKTPKVILSQGETLRLMGSGVVAFIADTLGLGSFAVNVALAKILGTFRDEELPAVNNGAQVIPGTLASLFFMQMIPVDTVTLVTLISATCLGGVVGGAVVSRLSKQAIRLGMMICFLLVIALLVARQCNLLPLTGTLTHLQGTRLLIGFVALVFCGAVTSIGVGLFALVQAVLFALNVSPLIAFPIMTTAGAMQQPLTSLLFLKNGKIPLKKTLVLSMGGCLGVLLALPLFHYLTIRSLHNLLLLILIYNFVMMSKAYFKANIPLQNSSSNDSLLVAK